MVGRSNFEYLKIDMITMTNAIIQELIKYRYQGSSPMNPFPSDSFRIPVKTHVIILSIWLGYPEHTAIITVVSSEHRITH